MLAALLTTLALAAPQDTTRLTGRVVDGSGAPIAGAEVRLSNGRGWGGAGPFRTDADGRLDVHFTPPGRAPVNVAVSAPGFLDASWDFEDGDVVPGQVLELGIVSLRPGGTLVGRVVDEDGDTVSGAWAVRVAAMGPEGEHRRVVRLRGDVDPTTGEYRLDGVPAGVVQVEAHHPALAMGTGRQEFTVEPGTETFVELVYAGPDPAGCLQLDVRVSGAPRTMAPLSIEVTAANGRTQTKSVSLRSGRGSALLIDLGPGPYTVAADDSRFEPVRLTDLAGATRQRIDIRGGCALVLDVVERESGRPVAGWGLSLLQEQRPPTVLVQPGTPVGPGHVVRHLLGGRQRLELQLPGRLPVTFETPELEAGRDVPYTLEVDSPRTIELTVVDAHGEPRPNVEIELTRGDYGGTSTGKNMRIGGRLVPAVDLSATSNSKGRARFSGLHAGRHHLRARFGPYVMVDRVVEASLEHPEVTIAAPPTGTLSIELLLPEGITPLDEPGDLRIDLRPEGLTNDMLFATGAPNVVCDADRLGPFTLPAGALVLVVGVRLPTVGGWSGTGFVPDDLPSIVAGQDTEYVLDLRDTCPAEIDLTFTVDGVTPEELDLRWDRSGQVSLHIQHDPGKHALLLSPGEHRLEFRSPGGDWFHQELLSLAPGQRVPLAIGLQRVRRVLQLVDSSTGDALGTRELSATLRVGEWSHEHSLATDSEGRVQLDRGPGRITLDCAGYEPYELEWNDAVPSLPRIALEPEDG